MKRPSREEYERAVALARAAIQARKGRPFIRAEQSPQAVLAKMQAKQAKGEALTEADFGAMAAALAEQDNRKRRGRGRPKGARDHAGHAALGAAIWAVQQSGLRPYRNNEGPQLSQGDAIADAMRLEGFRTLCSYDAARREMMAHRKGNRNALAGMAHRFHAINRDISKALEPVARRMQAFAQETSRAGNALGERLRGGLGLTDETRKTLEDYIKTAL